MIGNIPILGDGKLEYSTIEDCFFPFPKKKQRWGKRIKNSWRCSNPLGMPVGRHKVCLNVQS
jgi:hypothetical protein